MLISIVRKILQLKNTIYFLNRMIFFVLYISMFNDDSRLITSYGGQYEIFQKKQHRFGQGTRQVGVLLKEIKESAIIRRFRTFQVKGVIWNGWPLVGCYYVDLTCNNCILMKPRWPRFLLRQKTLFIIDLSGHVEVQEALRRQSLRLNFLNQKLRKQFVKWIDIQF